MEPLQKSPKFLRHAAKNRHDIKGYSARDSWPNCFVSLGLHLCIEILFVVCLQFLLSYNEYEYCPSHGTNLSDSYHVYQNHCFSSSSGIHHDSAGSGLEIEKSDKLSNPKPKWLY